MYLSEENYIYLNVFKEVSSAQQSCINFIKTVKIECFILLQLKITVYYLNK